jgi:hypothetical protein
MAYNPPMSTPWMTMLAHSIAVTFPSAQCIASRQHCVTVLILHAPK